VIAVQKPDQSVQPQVFSPAINPQPDDANDVNENNFSSDQVGEISQTLNDFVASESFPLPDRHLESTSAQQLGTQLPASTVDSNESQTTHIHEQQTIASETSTTLKASVSSLNIEDKKAARAARFGIPLTEEAKKEARAERFGSSSAQSSDIELKKELRAQRFGILTEAEKQKQLAAEKEAEVRVQ